MENKNEQKKLISIVITICSLFLALILAVSTFAWISMNRKLYATGASVTLEKNADLGIYKIMILKREGADNAKDVSGSGNVVLTEYDTVFYDKNVNTSIIMRLELGNLPYDEATNKYQPFHLRVKCEGAEEYISTKTNYTVENAQALENAWVEEGAVLHDSYWKQDGNLSQVLSNIIGIRCGLGTTFIKKVPDGVDKDGKPKSKEVSVDLNGLTDLNEIYTEAKEYLKTPVEGAVIDEQVFLNTTGTEKKGILEFNFSDYGDYVNDSGMVVVYIDVNYNDTLINLFADQLGFSPDSFDDGTGDSESVHFNSDLTNCFIFMGNKD